MNNEFEQIVPWNGAQDTGRDVRLKWQRNFERIKSNFEEISDSLKDISLEELQKLFLRKDIPDSTQFLLSLFKGAIFGKDGFASGLTGFGAKIDEYGNGEMENLFIRRSLTVPLLVYNRVDVQMGDKWRAPGVGIIDTVDTENKTCTLKLEDGEIGAVKAGDICMGIYHAMNSSDNATEDYDDSRGNRKFAGFCTVYFTITEVMGERNEQFKYQVRPVSERWTTSFDPFEQMTFVAYGSFTDEDRQTSVYETRTYTRMLWKQNTWEIASANIALQYGDLSNLNVHGMQMTGYSMYLNSVYFTGTIMQTKPDGTPVRTANDRGAWAAGHYDFYDRVSHDGGIWLCVNEDGTDTEPAEGNPDWLKQVDSGSAVSNLGDWYAGLFVPYLGIVRMGGSSWQCTVTGGTDNPPLGVIRDKDGHPIGYARSVWAMINMHTRRPIDLLSVNGGSIREFICDAPCPIDTPSRIKVNAGNETASLRAKYSDIDVNGHVNSIRYIEHILDLFPLQLYREKRVRRFEMAYVAESYYDDLLSFYVDREGENDTYEAAIRKNGGETVCRAKIVFEKS